MRRSVFSGHAILAILLSVIFSIRPAVADEGPAYVPASKVASECQMSMFIDELSNRLTLMDEDTEVVVTPGLDVASFDSKIVKLPKRTRFYKGEVLIPRKFADILKKHVEKIRKMRRKEEKKEQKTGKKLNRIVIDPGHGGRFPGAVANGLEEKEINLDISKMVKSLLEEQGIEVLMTRNRDIELSDDLSTDLNLRCDFTNSKKADAFVSIHANGSSNTDACGFEVFVARPDDEMETKSSKGAKETPVKGEDIEGELKEADRELQEIIWRTLLKECYGESMKLARHISKGLEANIDDDDRGVDDEHGFRVIKWTRCPAVLVEVGFMTHFPTALKLKQKSYRRKIARGIAKGILEFKKEFDATSGFTRPAESGK